ncbi:thiamine phosphate synthase [Candidatus Aerophobetes bacterium]|nr:thiamine phosphate synthase [Candidatus Aerophobetes bacterium]
MVDLKGKFAKFCDTKNMGDPVYMPSRQSIYRIIDANLNRAAEGLRVIEDALRFVIEEKKLTEKIKNLRHLLLGEIKNLPENWSLIISRESEKDVGKDLKEQPREKINELITANFRRVEEAERSLEEYGKLILPSWGEKFRQFRFQTYTLEKEVKVKLKKRKVDYTLYAITESSLKIEELLEKVKKIIKGGASVIQLREKNLSSKEFLLKAVELKKIIPSDVTFIINDRIDIALACDADGVHLGQEDIPLSFARGIMGEGKIIGISTHNLKEAKEAKLQGADYIGVGPIFPTSGKKDAGTPKGVKIITAIKNEVKIPVVAIGGISAENVQEVLKAGADGVAVISAIFSQKDVLKATRELYNKIQEFRHNL